MSCTRRVNISGHRFRKVTSLGNKGGWEGDVPWFGIHFSASLSHFLYFSWCHYPDIPLGCGLCVFGVSLGYMEMAEHVWASVGPSGVGVSMGEKEEEAEAADTPFYAFRSSFGDIDTGGDAGAGMSIRHWHFEEEWAGAADRHSGVFVAICLACSARHSTTPRPWNVVRVLCCPEGTRLLREVMRASVSGVVVSS
jgi:hypothetical protein